MTSASSTRRRWKYDVFLSFRGEDTRETFICHLYRALTARGIITFIDDESLERGSTIGPSLFTAIENSRIALVVLSENFASSSWCVDELLKILQCWDERRLIAYPIFYGVDPSDVRKQRESFQLRTVEVREHEEVYGNKDKLKQWIYALKTVANLAGWVSNDYKDNGKLIEAIVRYTLGKLGDTYTSSTVGKGLIGMDSRIEDLLSKYICPQLGGVRFIGIHGMRGIGKTTLALAIRDRICQDFDQSCFLSNVREKSLVSLQEKLVSKILRTKIENIDDEHAGAAMIKRRSCLLKVLVVIDDVDHINQLDKLAGSRDWFGPGSRIIITTPDIHLLRDVDDTYKATGLTRGEAIQLLSLKAFKNSFPPEDYSDLCHHIVGYAQGLPLALVVLGSFLSGRSTNEWESTIERLHNTPNRQVMDVLQISFDGLEEKDQQIFLHIACLYKGKDRDRVTQILDYCQLEPVIGLKVLEEKSLITIFKNKLSMHDLLQEMGFEIVRRESPDEPGKRSRLWSPNVIHNVLKKNKGTDKIRAMVMDLPELEVAHWKPEAFSNLTQLSLLHIRNVNLPEGLTSLSNSLRLLDWSGYPLRSLPQNFEADELIELNLCRSNIEHLWKGAKNFDKLKFIKLCHSQKIVQTPDLTGVQNLETLDLEGCKTLVELHQSLGQLKRLIVLNLKDCESLESLPSKIEMESLETLILSNCSKVKKIPQFAGNMGRLSKLYLDETAIETLPVSIGCLSGLASLNLSNCKNLVCLPSTISRLESLQNLDLSGCLKLGKQDSAREYGAIRTAVNHLTTCFCEVVGTYLSWSWPSRLVQRADIGQLSMQLPVSDLCYSTEQNANTSMSIWFPPSRLCNLTDLNISNCNLGDAAFANFACFPSLVALNLSGNNFVKLPPSIRSCFKLQNINLENCKTLQELSGLPSNRKLDVRADGCSSLEMLFDVSNFNSLEKSYFNFINCFKLNDNQGCSNIAFEMLRIFLDQQISSATETFQIVIPGNRIPEWFDHRRFGSSLTADLLPGWNKSRFLGFVLCAVFVLHEHRQVDELDVLTFKTFKATHHLVCCLKLNGKELEVYGKQPAFRFSEQFCQVESDHLWIFFVSRDKYFGTDWWHNSCRQLEFLFETRGPGLEVKECGVRLIYEQDVLELNQTITQSSSRMSSPYEDILKLLIDFENRVEGETSGTGSRT
ncbi:putative TIR domain, P-loop containing nucleoside triphosphate hydrolase [Rosa chinensis]|uniref:ADP-ribosyl cyclase/cyclic ADP-ribose hydrolase n=1 Tax=Rosa chinensis TaxID=74649 RepID=A0A2P6PKM1_ROSCH|nr:TMV resistance protein N [Rosa chinensis]XP_040364330.1 TMV resistance protein N [Rosa chinensis]XP_040364331.1 TMV resistance protein N [Rosa chinensis]XP_040364332.1 TMV resistance protein N [Rosa chinensis]PRQ22466.1 putative TIR domain, P-loop containing nucleoside triphosphate hydrolase [Rosa chinensis]